MVSNLCELAKLRSCGAFQPRARMEKLSNPSGIVDAGELLAHRGLGSMILEASSDAEPWQN